MNVWLVCAELVVAACLAALVGSTILARHRARRRRAADARKAHVVRSTTQQWKAAIAESDQASAPTADRERR